MYFPHIFLHLLYFPSCDVPSPSRWLLPRIWSDHPSDIRSNLRNFEKLWHLDRRWNFIQVIIVNVERIISDSKGFRYQWNRGRNRQKTQRNDHDNPYLCMFWVILSEVRWPSGLRRCTQVKACRLRRSVVICIISGCVGSTPTLTTYLFFFFKSVFCCGLVLDCSRILYKGMYLSIICFVMLSGICDDFSPSCIDSRVNDVYFPHIFLHLLYFISHPPVSFPRLPLVYYHAFDRTNPSEIRSNLRSYGISKDVDIPFKSSS